MLMFWVQTFSQSKKEIVYLLFKTNSSEKYKVEDGNGNSRNINKYRKKKGKDRVTFYIYEESFVLDKKYKIDTCNIKYLNKIKFETVQTINNKKEVLKDKYFFKNSIFEKIYLVEKYKDKIIKYRTIWNTDLIE
jgi:hypothetical protein